MTFSASRNSDIAPYLHGRLISGQWIVIMGDLEAVSILEKQIYTPGTKDNTGFEAIFGADRFIFLGRKTERLRVALNLADGRVWQDLFSIRCKLSPHGNDLLDVQERHFSKTADKNALIQSLVQELIEILRGYRE